MDNDKRLPGQTEWFTFEDRDAVSRAVPLLAELDVRELRTMFSWADWERPGARPWFDFYIPALGSLPGMRLLPVLCYTPPEFARRDGRGGQKTSYPPEDLGAYAAFASDMVERYGEYFDWIQLWNEPNWKPYWDSDMDPNGDLFAEMALGAARACGARGKKVALGGTAPLDYAWHARMFERGLLPHVHAVCFHYAPSWGNQHRRWFPLETEISALRAMLRGLGVMAEVWLDEAGISTTAATQGEDLEEKQVRFFDMMRTLPLERSYWYCLLDQDEETPTDDEVNLGAERDCVAYGFGVVRTNGSKKKLYEHWKRLV